MEILIYVLLVIIMGIFFFIDKYTKSQNAMFIIIIISIIGFVFIQNTPVEIVDYSKIIKVNNSYYQFETIDVTNSGVGIFTVQSFIVLVLWMFLILASVNIFLGKKEE